MKEYPYIYEVEPTNACPYRCIMCPRGRGQMKRPIGFMTRETFEKILSQISPWQKMLRLHHFGESLLHPDLPRFMELTRSAGLIPALSLNPSSLDRNMISALTGQGPGIVCFSLDSLHSDRLTAIRGIRKPVEYCTEMIDYFIEKSRRSSNKIFKIIQMVSLTINKDERKAFLSLKERYPEEDVYVYISHNYGFGDIGLVCETCEDDAEIISSGGSSCSAPFGDMVILWNGDVVLCCYDYDGSNVIGNINDDSLHVIWHGAKADRIREIFDRGESKTLPLCGNCFLASDVPGISHHPDLGRGLREEQYILSLFPAFRS